MSWFHRHLQGQDPQAAFSYLATLTRETGILAILTRACGRVGLRRFVVRIELKGQRTRITALETERPGPPAFDANAPALEQAIAELARRMPPGWEFSRLAIGVIRDQEGPTRPTFRFDEDADSFSLNELRMPKGKGIPTEDIAYLRAQDLWSARVAPLRAAWVTATGPWQLEGGRLLYRDQSWRAEAIATWVPKTGDFSWSVTEPVGDEAPFLHPELILELGPALDLVAFAAARMEASGVFQGSLQQPAGVQLFLALRD